MTLIQLYDNGWQKNMECDYMNGIENVYLACRKEAAEHNDKLKSREMAAEMLGVSTSTLANYEL